MRYVAASLSKAGPRSINEDAIAVLPTQEGLAVAVADGLGGMGGGARASRIAVDLFREFVRADLRAKSDLRALALAIHEEILAEQGEAPEFNSMATTFTGGFFVDNRLVGVHCGDSRIVACRGSGIRRLTMDHSEAQRLFEAGKLSREELIDYPRKNVLESALGIRGNAPEIDEIRFDVLPGDRFFLTTDGVHNKVLLRELRQLADQSSNPEKMVGNIEALVEARIPDDNYSAVIVYAD